MQALSLLTAIAPFSDAFMPGDEEFITVGSDRPMSIKESPATLTSLRKAHMPACGGYDQHTVASALTVTSRPVCSPWILKFSLTTQREEAKESYWCKGPKDVWLDAPVIDFIKTHQIATGTPRHERDRILRRAKVYVFNKGELQRRMPDGTLCVVPKPEERFKLIQYVHEQHGHFGVRRTTFLVIPYWWWVGIGQDIAHIVQSSQECDRANTNFNVLAKELQPIPVEGLFYRWGVDLAGPFNPTSKAGNKYIFVAIEHLSKHVTVAPMQEKSSTTTARLFVEHVLCRFGNCAEVITDVGTEFAGDFAELLRLTPKNTKLKPRRPATWT